MSFKKTKIVISIMLMFLMQGCISSKHNLSNIEVVVVSESCFKGDKIIMIIPSRGIIPDSLAISAAAIGNDGGFSSDLKKQIYSGNKQISVYSKNSKKMIAFLSIALSKFENDELKGISICYIGDKSNNKELNNQVKRVRVKLVHKKATFQ